MVSRLRLHPGAILALGLALIAAALVGAGTVAADTSGENASGYIWTDSNAPDPTTTFEWVDATGGTLITNTDCDDCSETVTLPFTFTFFGTDYTEIVIGTNGLLSFTTDDPDACNENYNWDESAIPHDDGTCLVDGWGRNPLIASWFDDLDPGECGDVYYETFGSEPDRTFVVQFDDVCHNDCFNCAAGEGVTFETILFEGSNDIKVQYQDAFFGDDLDGGDLTEENNGGTATTGLDMDGATGLQYSYNETTLTDALAVLYSAQQPTPTATATATATATGTPAPTSTPTAAPTALPPTGGQPADGSGLPWLAIALVVVALLSGGVLVTAQVRRRR